MLWYLVTTGDVVIESEVKIYSGKKKDFFREDKEKNQKCIQIEVTLQPSPCKYRNEISLNFWCESNFTYFDNNI